MGFLSALALVIIMARLDIRKFMGYPVIVDIAGSVLFAVLFAGTLTGMMVAVIAALTLSAIIYIVRLVVGYERFNFKTRSWAFHPPRYMTA
jgi:ABC-type microcin C transport system permease subunit YejB